jgi:hypothetical protein
MTRDIKRGNETKQTRILMNVNTPDSSKNNYVKRIGVFFGDNEDVLTASLSPEIALLPI